jgi:hypothetical protein
MATDYHYIIMSQKDFFENQVIEELLRERTNYYLTKNKIKDFWLLVSPDFVLSTDLIDKIKSTNFYSQQSQVIEDKSSNNPFYISLVSTNLEFIKWIKLRLGYFEGLDTDIERSFKSDGIQGKLNIVENKNILKCKPNLLHPDILTKQYKTSLSLYYSTC